MPISDGPDPVLDKLDEGTDDGEKCDRCGQAATAGLGEDTYWFADSPLWNEVYPDRVGIKCPRCFAEDCKAAGIGVGWRVGRVGEVENPEGVA